MFANRDVLYGSNIFLDASLCVPRYIFWYLLPSRAQIQWEHSRKILWLLFWTRHEWGNESRTGETCLYLPVLRATKPVLLLSLPTFALDINPSCWPPGPWVIESLRLCTFTISAPVSWPVFSSICPISVARVVFCLLPPDLCLAGFLSVSLGSNITSSQGLPI